MNNLLVIDDDLEILEVVKLLLISKGLKVKTEPQWQNIFKEIETCEPDVILMDIGLGTEDGRNITKQIKSNSSTCHIPVILFSAINDINKNLGDCLNDDFISKPFNLEDLFNKIQNQLHKASLSKNIDEDKLVTQMMADNPSESISLFYDKYASILFGYILSIVKNEGQSEKILIKIFTELATNRINHESKRGSFLMQSIRMANKTILETKKIEKQSLLPILKKYNQIQNN